MGGLRRRDPRVKSARKFFVSSESGYSHTGVDPNMTRERVQDFTNTHYGEEGRAILHSSLSEECAVTAGGRKNHSFVFSYGKTSEKTKPVPSLAAKQIK